MGIDSKHWERNNRGIWITKPRGNGERGEQKSIKWGTEEQIKDHTHSYTNDNPINTKGRII